MRNYHSDKVLKILDSIVLPAYKLKRKTIFSGCRMHDVTEARFIYYYILLNYTLLQGKHLAKMFLRANSNITHGIKIIKKRLNMNGNLAELIRKIEKEIEAL